MQSYSNVYIEKYWMHIFTLGVRHLKGGAGTKKARVQYFDNDGKCYPESGQPELVSSDPSATNANFRNVYISSL